MSVDPSGAAEVDPEAEDRSAESESANADEVDEAEQRLAADARAQLERNVAIMEAAQARAELIEDHQQIELEEIPLAGAQNGRENVVQAAGDPANQELLDAIQALREEVVAQRRVPTTLDSMKVRYFLAFCAVVGLLNALKSLYASMKSSLSGASSNGLLGDDPAKPNLHALVGVWLAGSDETAFWEKAASFVETNAPRSYPEQLLFMQFTEDIGRLVMQDFEWKSAADKMAFIAQASTRIGTVGLAATYRMLPTLSYGGEPLPRAIAANIMSHALVKWSRTNRKQVAA